MPMQDMITPPEDGSDIDAISDSGDDDDSGESSDTLGAFGAAGKGSAPIVSSVGAIAAGAMESAALNAQATIQRQNAQLDLEAGNANAARSQIISGQKIGSIEGAAGASGVTQSGSVLSILAASSMNAEMDRQNILHGAQVKAIQSENQASMDQAGATSAVNGSYFQAIGGLVGGGETAAAAFA